MSKNKWGGKPLAVGREAKLNKAAMLKRISQSLVLVRDNEISKYQESASSIGAS